MSWWFGRERLYKLFNNVFLLFCNYFHFEKGVVLHLKYKNWMLFTKGCFVTSLVEIGPVVLEKKILKSFSIYFYYFIMIFPLRRAWPFIWTNLNPIHPRMFCATFDWNLTSGSGEENKNVKGLQTDDGRQGIRKAHLSFQLR